MKKVVLAICMLVGFAYASITSIAGAWEILTEKTGQVSEAWGFVIIIIGLMIGSWAGWGFREFINSVFFEKKEK